jgi:hypothetical protein
MTTDQKFAGVLFILSLLMLFVWIPVQAEPVRQWVYPKLVAVWMGIVSFIITITARRNKDGLDVEWKEFKNKKGILRALSLVFMCVILSWLIDLFGFLLASFFFLATVLPVYGIKNWKILVLVPSLLPFGIHLLIEKVLRYPLPPGKIW